MSTFSYAIMNLVSNMNEYYCCSICEKRSLKVDADFYCKICIKYFCGTCIDSHRQPGGCFNEPYGKEKIMKWPLSKKMENYLIKCDLHKDEKFTMFCKDHSQFCCSKCVVDHYHSLCSPMTPIPQVSQQKSTDFDNSSVRTQETLLQIKQLQTYQECRIKDLNVHFSDYERCLDECENSTMSETNEQEQCTEGDTRQKISSVLAEFKKSTLAAMKEELKLRKAPLMNCIKACIRLHDDLFQLYIAIQKVQYRPELSFIANNKFLDKIQQCETHYNFYNHLLTLNRKSEYNVIQPSDKLTSKQYQDTSGDWTGDDKHLKSSNETKKKNEALVRENYYLHLDLSAALAREMHEKSPEVILDTCEENERVLGKEMHKVMQQTIAAEQELRVLEKKSKTWEVNERLLAKELDEVMQQMCAEGEDLHTLEHTFKKCKYNERVLAKALDAVIQRKRSAAEEKLHILEQKFKTCTNKERVLATDLDEVIKHKSAAEEELRVLEHIFKTCKDNERVLAKKLDEMTQQKSAEEEKLHRLELNFETCRDNERLLAKQLDEVIQQMIAAEDELHVLEQKYIISKEKKRVLEHKLQEVITHKDAAEKELHILEQKFKTCTTKERVLATELDEVIKLKIEAEEELRILEQIVKTCKDNERELAKELDEVTQQKSAAEEKLHILELNFETCKDNERLLAKELDEVIQRMSAAEDKQHVFEQKYIICKEKERVHEQKLQEVITNKDAAERELHILEHKLKTCKDNERVVSKDLDEVIKQQTSALEGKLHTLGLELKTCTNNKEIIAKELDKVKQQKIEAEEKLDRLKLNFETCKDNERVLAKELDEVKQQKRAAEKKLLILGHKFKTCKDNKKVLAQKRIKDIKQKSALQEELHVLEQKFKTCNYNERVLAKDLDDVTQQKSAAEKELHLLVKQKQTFKDNEIVLAKELVEVKKQKSAAEEELKHNLRYWLNSVEKQRLQEELARKQDQLVQLKYKTRIMKTRQGQLQEIVQILEDGATSTESTNRSETEKVRKLIEEEAQLKVESKRIQWRLASDDKMYLATVSTMTEDFTQRCEEHKDDKQDMFCFDHDQQCCAKCVFLHHRHCQYVTFISELKRLRSTMSVQGNPSNMFTVQGKSRQGNPSNMFTVQGKSRHNVRIRSDSHECTIVAICVLPDGQILIADQDNNKVKLLNKQYQVVSHFGVTAKLVDMCHITSSDVALALDSEVQIITVDESQFYPGRKFLLQHVCEGIAHHQGDVYVTSGTVLYKYSMSGESISKLYQDTSVKWPVLKCGVSSTGKKLYITNWDQSKLLTLGSDGKVLATLIDPELKSPCGVNVTPAGQVLVCGWKSHTIVQLDSDGGRKLATLATKERDGVRFPLSVCFSSTTSSIIVGQAGNSNIHVFRVK